MNKEKNKGRKIEPLSERDVKIIISLQNGENRKNAALNAGVQTGSDLNKPVQRAEQKMRKSLLCKAIRGKTKELHGLIIIGKRLRPFTPELEAFTNIEEPHRCFLESLLEQGWVLKDGKIYNPND